MPLVVVAGWALVAVVVIVIKRRGRSQAQERLRDIPRPELRTTTAASLGQASLGPSQVPRSGTLMLTAGEVAFAQWRPARLVRIPRPSIVAVDTTREHLGKESTCDLLRIRWTSTNGEGEDSIAFVIRHLDTWVTDLGGQRVHGGP